MAPQTHEAEYEAEYDQLPLAVRRKYFSSLERLRITQKSSAASSFGSPPRQQSLRERRRITSGSDSISPRRIRKSSRSASLNAGDVSWFLSLPDKIQRKHFSEEERLQFVFNRESVILDAADEAVLKRSRRHRQYEPVNQEPLERAPLTPTSNESFTSDMVRPSRPNSVALAMADSFRWMDEDSNLDLRLQLDNYHANLPDVVIPKPESSVRPSFRRNMSITKMPFGRPSVPAPISTSTSFKTLSRSSFSHRRQRSRAVSLMSPKLSPSEESARHSIDPNATHYQNPDARLKLRVYLASPQKFDEAIEFGFPTEEGMMESADKENQVPNARHHRNISQQKGPTDANQTFFDDAGSMLEDDLSMIEPESPVTPHEEMFKQQHSRLMSVSETTTDGSDFAHLGFRRPTPHRHAESYSTSMSGSREMTLRMTLTRPDLRADDDTIYGWQSQRSRSPPAAESENAEQSVMKGPFDGEDGWGPAPKDGNKMKRLWNRVRANRKSSLSLAAMR